MTENKSDHDFLNEIRDWSKGNERSGGKNLHMARHDYELPKGFVKELPFQDIGYANKRDMTKNVLRKI